jgi:hypothetical protein
VHRYVHSPIVDKGEIDASNAIMNSIHANGYSINMNGGVYHRGRCGVEQNDEEALDWYTSA